MNLSSFCLACVATLTLVSGCQKDKTTPIATSQDIEAAKQAAQREVADAKAEATKDVKSATKVSGADAAVVNAAKLTASYDVAMAKADGDHKIALEKCLALQIDVQQACKDQADSSYASLAAAAKATRLAKRQ